MTEIDVNSYGKKRVRFYCDRCNRELHPQGFWPDGWMYRYEDETLCPACALEMLEVDGAVERLRE